MNTMKKTLWILALVPMFSLAGTLLTVTSEQVVPVATASSCLTSKITLTNPSVWYAQGNLSITNNCGSPQILNRALVSFQSNSTNITAMWGGANSSDNFSYQNNIASTLLNITTDPLAAGQTLTLSFGINLSGTAFDLVTANSTLQVTNGTSTPTNGAIQITVDPTGVTGMNGSSEIDITGTNLSKPYVIINANWTAPTTYNVTGLAYGTYTITAKPLSTLYTGVATPSTVSVTNTSPVKATVTYKPAPATGTLKITLSTAPITGLATTVNATLTNTVTLQKQTVNIAWNGSTTVPSLTGNQSYSLVFPNVTNGVSIAKPVPISNFSIAPNTTYTVAASYQAAQTVPTQIVTFNVTGLTTTTLGSLIIKDSFGTTFTKSGFGNGMISQALPINDKFGVTASAPNMSATVTPSSFTIASGQTLNVNVNFTPNSTTTSTAHFMAFADTGMQSSNSGLVAPAGSNMTEAFILYNPWQKKSTLWAIEPGDAISQMIVKTPNTFASVGGASAPYPWDYETVAQGVAEIEALIDYYHFIGIDFDVEGAALETPAVQTWVAQAALQLRRDRPNLILTLTVPDPVIGFTTGAVSILNQTLKANGNKMVFNWVNKMDFDEAGLGNGCTQTDTNMNNNCLVISATTAAQQLATMLNISQQQAYQYLGEIFMVPVDDQGHPLSTALASQVATYLKNLGVTHMGYWRIQNDPGLTYGNLFCKILGLQ